MWFAWKMKSTNIQSNNIIKQSQKKNKKKIWKNWYARSQWSLNIDSHISCIHKLNTFKQKRKRINTYRTDTVHCVPSIKTALSFDSFVYCLSLWSICRRDSEKIRKLVKRDGHAAIADELFWTKKKMEFGNNKKKIAAQTFQSAQKIQDKQKSAERWKLHCNFFDFW